jgi:2-hydroxy-3-oxopropionate reductase
VADVASRCDVVITSLPIPKVVEDVTLGPDGIAEHAKPGTVFIDLSTNSPATAKRVAAGMAAKGIPMLEARSPAAPPGPRTAPSSSWSAATPPYSNSSCPC